MPDRTQEIKNLRAVATACKNYTDKKIEDLEWQIGTYNYDVATDSNVARIKTLPSDTYKSMVNYIGGKTCKYNQLVLDTFRNYSYNLGQWGSNFLTDVNIVENHKYLLIYKVSSFTSGNLKICFGNLSSQPNAFTKTIDANTTLNTEISSVFTANSAIAGYKASIYNLYTTTAEGTFAYINFIDLTDIFGAGNEPSTVETAIPLLKANGYKLDGTDTYSTGKWKNAVVSGVKYNPINEFNPSDCWYTSNGNVYTTDGVSFNTTPTFTKGNINNSPSGFWGYVRIDVENKDYVSVSGMPVLYGVKQVVITDENYNILNSFASNDDSYNISNIVGRKYLLYVTNKPSTADYSNAMFEYASSSSSTYIPYVAPITKAIPSEVLADNRYGLGFDNTNYNHLDSDGHLRGSWGIVDLGSLNYTYDSANTRFTATLPSGKGYEQTAIPNLLNTIYEPKAFNYLIANPNVDMVMGVNSSGIITIRNFNYTDVATFKTAMSGVYLVYELATAFDQDYSQYFTDGWNKVDLDKQYATCEMVVAEPIDMPNSITNLIKEVKA